MTRDELAAFHGGDERIFRALVAAQGPRLSAFCRRYTESWDDALELEQDTWVLAWERRRQYRGEGSIGGWLLRIARTVCRRASKRHPRSEPIDAVLDLPAPVPMTVEQAVADQELADDQLCRIMALPERQRMAVLARYCVGYSVRETAQLLGCAQGTVKAACHHAIRSLASHEGDPGKANGRG